MTFIKVPKVRKYFENSYLSNDMQNRSADYGNHLKMSLSLNFIG